MHDVYNVVGAGSSTAATFGLISKKKTFIERTFFSPFLKINLGVISFI